MLLGAVVERFIARTPTAVAVRGAFEYALSPAALDALFETVVGPRDDRRLLFPTCVDLMATVVRRVNPSTHAAYQADDHLPVQVTALYARSARVPAAAGRELVRHTADRLAPAIRAMGGAAPDPLPGYRVKVLDGNHRGKTRRRIKPLRGGGRRAAAGAADGVSDYHLALEVSGACPGRWVAVPEETWEVIGGWSVGRMAGGLVGLARHANLRRYREATRGPKKPRPPRTRFAKAKHIATARPLNGEQAGP